MIRKKTSLRKSRVNEKIRTILFNNQTITNREIKISDCFQLLSDSWSLDLMCCASFTRSDQISTKSSNYLWIISKEVTTSWFLIIFSTNYSSTCDLNWSTATTHFLTTKLSQTDAFDTKDIVSFCFACQ